MGKIKVDDLMKIIEPYIKGKVYDEIRESIEERGGRLASGYSRRKIYVDTGIMGNSRLFDTE